MSEALESQTDVTVTFTGLEEDMRIINGAPQSAGAVARGSIAWVLTDNTDEDEADDEADDEPDYFFTDKTIATPPNASEKGCTILNPTSHRATPPTITRLALCSEWRGSITRAISHE